MYACSSPSGTEEPYSADAGELWLRVYTGHVVERPANAARIKQLRQAAIELPGKMSEMKKP